MTSAASPSMVRDLLQRYQLHPKKKWGQNFLVDKNILARIVQACDLEKDSLVVEIGPGLGALTELLAKSSAGVLSIDIDRQLQPLLEETLDGLSNVRLLFQDILEVDLEKELARAFSREKVSPYKVCANIPYNITTPIIFYLLETCPNLQSAVLMMQKEVATRLLASPGNKDYGLLTLMVAYHAHVELITRVSHNCFYPHPEVDSSVVKISPYLNQRKKVTVKDEKEFKSFMKSAFQKRRKTILNICADFFKRGKPEIADQLKVLGIRPEQRPEQLTLEDFAGIADAFFTRRA